MIEDAAAEELRRTTNHSAAIPYSVTVKTARCEADIFVAKSRNYCKCVLREKKKIIRLFTADMPPKKKLTCY